ADSRDQPRQRHRIGSYPGAGEHSAQRIERRVDQRAELGIEHGRQFLVTRPITAPVISVARLPASQLFIPSPATSLRRAGHSEPTVVTISPTLARFATPDRA